MRLDTMSKYDPQNRYDAANTVQIKMKLNKKTDSDLHTVRGSPANTPGSLHRDGKLIRTHQDRVEDRDLLAHPAALLVRSGNPDTPEAGGGFRQADDPLRVNAVVIDNENVLAHIHDSSLIQIAASIKKSREKVKGKNQNLYRLQTD